MPAMHEYVDEQAGKRQNPDQCAKDMSAVLGEHENARDDKEPEKDQPRPGCEDATPRRSFPT